MKAKVRGIYTTALTKMLLENGFEIVQPSQAVRTRFSLVENNEPQDIKIDDRHDLQGVVALGTREAVETFKAVLHENFEDAVTRKWNISVDGIYKGIVVDENGENVYVKIGNDTVGFLPKEELPPESRSDIVVQVDRRGAGRKKPILTTNLKIVGNFAILVPKGNVGVSLKIRDMSKRTELYTLGGQLLPEGWGVIWREHAAYKPKNVLEGEIAVLVEKARILGEKAKSAEAPALLLEGLYFMNVEFPHASKSKLDASRASVTPTLNGHHFYKSCGGKVSAALEMAENLLEKGKSLEEVEQLFRSQIFAEFPVEGSTVEVEHVKLNGAVFHLGKARLEALNTREIKYYRPIRFHGVYNGLGVAKEAGDMAVSETKPGLWHIVTNYFSKDNVWKGAYININTPVEVYPKTLRYVDLEVDVCIKPSGEVEIVDVEKLEKAFQKGIVSKALLENAKAEAEKIVKEKPKRCLNLGFTDSL